MMGVDPYSIVDVPEEDYLIKSAMLRKAIELHTEEVQITARLIGQAIAQSL